MGVLSRRDQEKIEIEKQVRKIMSSPSYKKRMKEYEAQFTLHAMVKLCFITMEYLEMKHRYKKDGLRKYVEFLKGRIGDLPDDEKYFKDVEKYYRNELGMDVLKIFDLHIADEIKNFEKGGTET